MTIPPTTTRARGCWVCAPMPVATAAGKQSEARGHAGHDDGTHLVEAAFFEAVHGAFFALRAADSGQKDDRAERCHAGERGEADGCGDAEGVCG